MPQLRKLTLIYFKMVRFSIHESDLMTAKSSMTNFSASQLYFSHVSMISVRVKWYATYYVYAYVYSFSFANELSLLNCTKCTSCHCRVCALRYVQVAKNDS